MKRAVVLLSGGIDSTVTLAIVKSEGYEVYALSFDYGQRHGIELCQARKSAEHFQVKKHLIISCDLREIGGSALTSDVEVPKENNINTETITQANKSSTVISEIPVTYVPARNTIFLSYALAFAESIESENIFIGANVVDYSGYPDCRPEYMHAFEKMANLATKTSVQGRATFKVNTPLIHMTKAEIIKRGADLGVNFSFTWSCYDPQKTRNASLVTRNGFVPCRRCDSCIIRSRGFREAGIKDPLNHQVNY
ncbi:7-cyano-7-deazaguanine synthase QueC [bacterium]|nr:MAG: 7-cyano-7-deazaguanine synthase QueC [bacterium]